MTLFLALRTYSAHLTGFTNAPWDVAWYASIVDGYVIHGPISAPQNLAFLPLAAYAARFFSTALGFSNAGALLIVACGSSLVAAALLPCAMNGRERCLSAVTAAAVLFFNPFAIYFFNGYPEAAFLLCTVGFFAAWKREWRGPAALLAGVALLARPHAVVLFAAHALFIARRQGRPVSLAHVLSAFMLDAPLMLAPIAAFSTWQYLRFGDPLGYVHAIHAWMPTSVWSYPSVLLHMGLFQVIAVLIYLGMITLSVWIWRRRRCPYALVSLMHLAFVALTMSIENLGRHSIINVAFAISVGLAAPGFLDMIRGRKMLYATAVGLLGCLCVLGVFEFCKATMRFYVMQWVS